MENTYSRFDFEQQILRCWGIIDDLREIKSSVEGDKGSENFVSYLDSLCVLYELKFSELFRQFELSIEKPFAHTIFICAGNIIQYDAYVKQFRDVSPFRFLNWPDQIRGTVNPIVHYIGTYEHRKDIAEIRDMVKTSTRTS
jgi:hypothetical protein